MCEGRDNNWLAFVPKPSQGREREGKGRSAAALGGRFLPLRGNGEQNPQRPRNL